MGNLWMKMRRLPAMVMASVLTLGLSARRWPQLEPKNCSGPKKRRCATRQPGEQLYASGSTSRRSLRCRTARARSCALSRRGLLGLRDGADQRSLRRRQLHQAGRCAGQCPALRTFNLLPSSGTGTLGTLRSASLMYATMTGTDMAIYKLTSTYARIAARFGVAPLTITDTHPRPARPSPLPRASGAASTPAPSTSSLPELREGAGAGGTRSATRSRAARLLAVRPARRSSCRYQRVIGINNTGSRRRPLHREQPLRGRQHGQCHVERARATASSSIRSIAASMTWAASTSTPRAAVCRSPRRRSDWRPGAAGLAAAVDRNLGAADVARGGEHRNRMTSAIDWGDLFFGIGSRHRRRLASVSMVLGSTQLTRMPLSRSSAAMLSDSRSSAAFEAA